MRGYATLNQLQIVNYAFLILNKTGLIKSRDTQ